MDFNLYVDILERVALKKLSSYIDNVKTLFGIIKVVHRANKYNNLSYIDGFRRLIDLVKNWKYNPEEAYINGLLKKPFDDPKKGISKRELSRMQHSVNINDWYYMVEDKSFFYQICEARAIPIPKVFGVCYKGQQGYWDNIRVTTLDCWHQIFSDLKKDIIIKPTRSNYGRDVYVFRCNGAFFEKSVIKEIISLLKSGNFIIQELLESHSQIAEMTCTKTLQSARMMTVLKGSGEVEVIDAAFIKFVANDSIIDNFHHGTTGNLVAQVDSKTGLITQMISEALPGGGFGSISTHPVSGINLIGLEIPLWNEAIIILKKAAKCFPALGTLGWDVAFTDQGVRLIEANFRYDPFVSAILGKGDSIRSALIECDGNY